MLETEISAHHRTHFTGSITALTDTRCTENDISVTHVQEITGRILTTLLKGNYWIVCRTVYVTK